MQSMGSLNPQNNGDILILAFRIVIYFGVTN